MLAGTAGAVGFLGEADLLSTIDAEGKVCVP